MIPAEAVEAAAKAIYGLGVPDWQWDERDKELQNLYREDARAALESAAPHIRAQALEEAAAEVDEGVPAYGQDGYADWLRARAVTERNTL